MSKKAGFSDKVDRIRGFEYAILGGLLILSAALTLFDLAYLSPKVESIVADSEANIKTEISERYYPMINGVILETRLKNIEDGIAEIKAILRKSGGN